MGFEPMTFWTKGPNRSLVTILEVGIIHNVHNIIELQLKKKEEIH